MSRTMGLGLRNTIGIAALCALSNTACSDVTTGALATDTTVAAVLCDTAARDHALRESRQLRKAFAAQRSTFSQDEQESRALPNIETVLAAPISFDARRRVHAAYAWDTTSVLHEFGKRHDLPIPEYTVEIDAKTLVDYALGDTKKQQKDSTLAAIFIRNGFPAALTTVGYDRAEQQISDITINPFFVDEALEVAVHELFHIWQFHLGSPLAINDHPYESIFIEATATYANERFKYGLERDAAIDTHIREHFAESSRRAVKENQHVEIILKYHLIPAFIAHDAVLYGPENAIFRARTPAQCMVEPPTGPTGQPR